MKKPIKKTAFLVFFSLRQGFSAEGYQNY